MCAFHHKLVNHAIDANRSTCQFHYCIRRIVEDEMVPVEMGEFRASDPSGNCWNMVHVWFLHHRPHSLFDLTCLELEVRVLFPNGIQIKIRASKERGLRKVNVRVCDTAADELLKLSCAGKTKLSLLLGYE